MSDDDIAKAVGPFWRNGAPVATLDDVIARQAAELDALRARVAELNAECDERDEAAVKHVGEIMALRARVAELEAELNEAWGMYD